MAELLAWDGPWSDDLIRMGMMQAIEIEAARSREIYSATAAAVSGLFSKKGPKAFLDGMEHIGQVVKAEQLAARGVAPGPEHRSASAADALLKAFGKLGVKTGKKARGKK